MARTIGDVMGSATASAADEEASYVEAGQPSMDSPTQVAMMMGTKAQNPPLTFSDFDQDVKRLQQLSAADAAKEMVNVYKKQSEILAKENPGNTTTTGWRLDQSGKHFFHISDKEARLKSKGWNKLTTPNVEVKLGDLLDHPVLFKQYPGLRNLPIRSEILSKHNALGIFDNTLDEKKYTYIGVDVERMTNLQRTGTGNFSNKPSDVFEDPKYSNLGGLALGTILHEVQHAIDNIEGWPYIDQIDPVVANMPGEKDPRKIPYKGRSGEMRAFSVEETQNMSIAELRKFFSRQTHLDPKQRKDLGLNEEIRKSFEARQRPQGTRNWRKLSRQLLRERYGVEKKIIPETGKVDEQ